MTAAIRPDGWNWLLTFHLLAAFLLVGGVLTVLTVSLAAVRGRRPEHVPLLRAIAFWTNLSVVLPGFVAVHVLGDVLAGREYEHGEPGWLSASFAVTDLALLVGGVLSTALQWWVLRRARAGLTGGWPALAATWLPAAVLAALAAVIVLMAAKPIA